MKPAQAPARSTPPALARPSLWATSGALGGSKWSGVEVASSSDMMPGVVSLPHGWGHGRQGVQLAIARAQPGASANDLTDERQLDALSGNAALNGVPVEVLSA